jgi:hypothetical protein
MDRSLAKWPKVRAELVLSIAEAATLREPGISQLRLGEVFIANKISPRRRALPTAPLVRSRTIRRVNLRDSALCGLPTLAVYKVSFRGRTVLPAHEQLRTIVLHTRSGHLNRELSQSSIRNRCGFQQQRLLLSLRFY